ncbi:MAG: PD40 domain-containing protein [Acidobacteria bacterium]|nr:PD40 domain-containing protein [Acidobacteriota bacterium]
MKTGIVACTLLALLLLAGATRGWSQEPSHLQPGERHLRNLRQLTRGGENAEAYFDFEGRRLIYQSTRPPYACDQIFMLDLASASVRLLSTGKGRTTCGYFLPDGQHVIYASTHLGSDQCPPRPGHQQGYVWPLYKDYDIFQADLAGRIVKRLTHTEGYDAEATVSPDGRRIVFTSVRDGDLEIYSMNLDGGDVRRLTHEPGYDGGAFYSPDSKKIVYRASRPAGEELASYRLLLRQALVKPTRLEIFVMDADGSNKRQVTANGAANFAPYFHPSGKKIIFSSNVNDPTGRRFELYLINLDGTALEQVTFSGTFDAFPMFSPDGKQLVFASNRGARESGETNVFLADWVE